MATRRSQRVNPLKPATAPIGAPCLQPVAATPAGDRHVDDAVLLPLVRALARLAAAEVLAGSAIPQPDKEPAS